MATSIYLPKNLLAAVDKRARGRGMSRNRFIVQTLEKELANSTEWSPGYFEKLRDVKPGDAKVMGEMLSAIRAARTRKRAPRL